MNFICPTCKLIMDTCKDVEGDLFNPAQNDLSICFNCGELLVFNSKMELDKATAQDLLSLYSHQFEQIQFCCRKIKERDPFPQDSSDLTVQE
jgi:hypothetical protein